MGSDGPRTATILIAEDDEIDRKALRRSFARSEMAGDLIFARDGEECLELLRARGDTAITQPLILLLDINMPRKTGWDVLHELRADAALSGTVTFVLTTSEAEEDIRRAYALNVAGYIVKHQAGRGFQDVAALLEKYRNVVELPAGDPVQ